MLNIKSVIEKLNSKHTQSEEVAIHISKKDFKAVVEAIMGKKLTIDEGNQDAVNQIWLYLNRKSEFIGDLNKGICLFGPKGTCKTTLLKALNECLTGTELKCKFQSIPQLSDDFEKSGVEVLEQYKKSNMVVNSPSFRGIKRCHVIADDIGREKMTAQSYGDKRGVGSTFIYDRYILWQDHRVLTHFTTNFDMTNAVDFSTFSDRYGDLNADRLREMCNFIQITGESKRG